VQIIRSTLRHNLDFTGQCSDEEILDSLKKVELSEWVESLPKQLDTWIGPGEWEPSGGELKRIGLARLLLKQADILLLDEPFAGMDAELQTRLIKTLRELWQQKLVLLVSHDLEQQDSNDTVHHL
jgi:ATP-binding cassette subfamily C protein CydC